MSGKWNWWLKFHIFALLSHKFDFSECNIQARLSYFTDAGKQITLTDQKKPSWNSLQIVDKLKARDTHTPTHGLASTWLERTAISPGQWQLWTAVSPLLELISVAKPSGFARWLTRRLFQADEIWWPTVLSHSCFAHYGSSAWHSRRVYERAKPDGYAILMSSNKGETAVHGCHCPGDMAVRMGQVLARPWVGACVPLAISLEKWRTHSLSI